MRFLSVTVHSCVFVAIGVVAACSADWAVAGPRRLIKFSLDGQSLEGAPLLVSNTQAVLLARDGSLLRIDPRKVDHLRQTTVPFRPYSVSRMRSHLEREFGRAFEVSATGHYVVVHPRGHGDQWSGRFEELYRSFRHYFQVRGLNVEEPEFPLIAVVLRSHAEFRSYNASAGSEVPSGTLGYYSPTTNRVTMYDVTAGKSATSWSDNAVTIIHEATHQTAFNTGIHNRLAPPPRWIAEGLGTLFEARGVWDSRHTTRSSARLNRPRLAGFRRYLAQRTGGESLAELISSDRAFQSRVDDAYSECWALSYYLLETQPRKYAQLLRRASDREDFTLYSSSDRLADFTDIFGQNLRLLDAKFLRFMETQR